MKIGLNELKKLVKTTLHEIYYTGLSYGHTGEDIIPIIRRVRELWRYYLISRYPYTETEVGE